jgi:hypothetical protein
MNDQQVVVSIASISLLTLFIIVAGLIYFFRAMRMERKECRFVGRIEDLHVALHGKRFPLQVIDTSEYPVEIVINRRNLIQFIKNTAPNLVAAQGGFWIR